MTQEGSTGTVQQNSSSNQKLGHDTPSEQLVTPELEAKFKEVFGGDTKDDGEEGKKLGRPKNAPKQLSSDARNKATLAKQRKAQQRNQFFGGTSDEDDTEEKGAKGESEESAQNRSQPLQRGTAKQTPAQNGSQASRAQQQSKPSEEEGEEVDQDQDADQSTQDEGDGDDDKPTLNPVLRHAARRAGWSAEEANEFFEQNPEKAEQYFQKMHDAFNSVSAQFATLGSPAQQQQQGQQPPAPQQQRQQPPQQQQQNANADPVDELIAAMYGTTADKLATDYNPEFVEEFARKPARYLQEHVIAPLKQMQAHYQAQQARMVAQEATSYTKGLEADFADLYGTAKGRSKDQQAALNDVYQQADFIYAGAQRKGVSMTVSEALERAHAIVASKFLEQSTRKRVLASVRKRSSQLTQRPTQRKPGKIGQDGKPVKSIEAATEALTKRMAELGIE